MQEKKFHSTENKVKNLLGIHINYKFKFNTRMETICRKAHRKFNVVLRITNKAELSERFILMNTFLKLNSTIVLLLRSFTAVV